MNGWQLIGPVGIYEGGDHKLHIYIEGVEGLEAMIREMYGADVEIVYEMPKRSLDSRIACIEEELRILRQSILEEK